MKKNIIFILCILVLLCTVLTIYSNYNSDNKILENTINQNNKIINSNSLTIMYETESGSGEYQISSDTTWPTDGYTFNERLSKCENGSILTWNDENKKVIMQANTSDKCYVYFDRISEKPIINNVEFVTGDGFFYISKIDVISPYSINAYYIKITNDYVLLDSYNKSLCNLTNSSFTYYIYVVDEFGNQSDVYTNTISLDFYGRTTECTVV